MNIARYAALALLLGTPPGAQPAQQTILVWSFAFSPRSLHLVAGQPVTLTFVNRSGSTHDFTARQFFGNSSIRAGDAREGQIELAPHETKSVTLLPRAGIYHAHCSHFFHKQMGMAAEIIVE